MKRTDRSLLPATLPLPATLGVALSLAVTLTGCQSSRMRTAERPRYESPYDSAYDGVPVPQDDGDDPLPVRSPNQTARVFVPNEPPPRSAMPPSFPGPHFRNPASGLSPDQPQLLLPDDSFENEGAEVPEPAVQRRPAPSNPVAAEFSSQAGTARVSSNARPVAGYPRQLANAPREIVPAGQLVPLNTPPTLLVPPTGSP